jgi:1-acyl-sn-glycerol-3-phosphate acyltransferase
MLIVVLAVLLLLPLGKPRNGNLIYNVCHVWARCWLSLVGIHYKEKHESPHNRQERFIFIANHSSYMDAPVLAMCMRQPVRVLGKYEMVRYPLFGIIYRSIVIVVDRSSPEKRARSLRALTSALHKGLSIFVFPEGTFNVDDNKPLKSFYDGAFRLAIETQTPIRPILFLDSRDRMHWSSIFSLNPGKLTTVFLSPVSIADYNTEADLPSLKQKVYDVMDAGLRRYRHFPGSPLSDS